MKFPPGSPTWDEINKKRLWWYLAASGLTFEPVFVYVGEKVPWSAWDVAWNAFLHLLDRRVR